MKCLSCSHNWKRTKLTEYVSLLASCPNCGSRLLARNDFILSIINANVKDQVNKSESLKKTSNILIIGSCIGFAIYTLFILVSPAG